MTKHDFAYKVILSSRDPSTITSLVAYQAAADQPLRAVTWSVPQQEWIFAPYLVSRILFDDMEQSRGRTVDRTTAEHVAREVLHTELPSEIDLAEMSDEGERNGWNYGPPRG
ncbi:hypothetical protein [Actinoplanes sp. URMC 104]|uniref:hypothetical protein n=1 Tax=Actinoplanes sp. URMC 104 TaxID=3423409 RepID=UPI003F1B2F8A